MSQSRMNRSRANKHEIALKSDLVGELGMRMLFEKEAPLHALFNGADPSALVVEHLGNKAKNKSDLSVADASGSARIGLSLKSSMGKFGKSQLSRFKSSDPELSGIACYLGKDGGWMCGGFDRDLEVESMLLGLVRYAAVGDHPWNAAKSNRNRATHIFLSMLEMSGQLLGKHALIPCESLMQFLGEGAWVYPEQNKRGPGCFTLECIVGRRWQGIAMVGRKGADNTDTSPDDIQISVNPCALFEACCEGLVRRCSFFEKTSAGWSRFEPSAGSRAA